MPQQDNTAQHTNTEMNREIAMVKCVNWENGGGGANCGRCDSLSRFLPKSSLYFCLLFFAALSGVHLFSNYSLKRLGGAVYDTVLREQSSDPKHPQIIIAGSSLAGLGIHVDALEKATGLSAAKIALSVGTACDMCDIAECFPALFRETNVFLFELAPSRLCEQQESARAGQFALMKETNRFMAGDIAAIPALLRSFFAQRTSFMALCGNYRRIDPLQFEEKWTNLRFYKRTEKGRQQLREQASKIRQERMAEHSLAENKMPKVREDQKEALYRLLDWCRERGIFFVAFVTPSWYGLSNYTQSDLQKETADPYLLLLQDINQRSDCAVVIARNFEEITATGTDDDYLFDAGHMTEEGAKVYTNWLFDRLLEHPKAAQALRPAGKIY